MFDLTSLSILYILREWILGLCLEMRGWEEYGPSYSSIATVNHGRGIFRV